MDVLGLATLDIIEIALQMIEERHKKRVNIDAINLHDKDVLSGLAEGDTLGIFQFESGGMRRLLKSLAQGGAFRFEDAVAATALYRPGPMDSGMLDSYVNRKQGAEIISYDHPDLEEALADTYGVMVYQEQVMRASQILAGYSMAEADNLRKVMGKKLKEAMSAEREKFIEGCKATVEWEEERAGSVFDKIAAFAGYGFNKSHALAYTLISYQAMWLKNYYPEEFYAATLSIVKEDKLQGIVKDAAKRNIIVSPPDINMSKDTFAIGYDDERKRSVLYAPFNRLKGASDKTANAILEAREKVGGRFDSKEQFLDAVNKRSCNVRVQETLEKVGAFASLDAEATPALHPDRLKDQKLLMPGLSVEDLKVSRKMRMNMEETKEFKRMLAELEVKEATEDERRRAIADRKAAELEDEEFKPTRVHPLPFIGKEPKIMVVTDYPSFSESEKGQMTQGKGFDYVKSAMREHGLSRQDGYFTALSKRPKPKGEKVTSEVVKQYSDYLKKEVELLKPSVIVALGGLSIRYFMPDVKGSFEDLCGQAHYMPDIDATVYFGINPMMVYMQPDRQSMLDDVFARVAQAMS
jgi:DNA polymerase-3 subunit alpha